MKTPGSNFFVVALCFACFLAGGLGRGAWAGEKARIVHFPEKFSVGKLWIEDANSVRKIKDSLYWADGVKRESLGAAQCDVVVPVGKRLALRVSKRRAGNLSFLSDLRPGDLYSLILLGTPANDKGMEHIVNLTGLRVLNLGKTKISSRAMRFIRALPNLERLTVSPHINDAGLAEVCQLKSLRAVYFKGSKVTNNGLAYLANLPHLEELELGGSPRIDNRGLVHLSQLKSLRYLLLWGVVFTDNALVHVSKVPSLKVLKVSIPQLTNAGLANISRHQGLEILDLHWRENITDAGVVHLKKMASLKKLDIKHSKITDKGLATLAEIKRLEYLKLPWSGLTDDGLAHISRLNNLKYLAVGASSISSFSDEGFKHVAGLVNLEELQVGGSGITDVGLSYIARLENLRRLWLCYCHLVTDEGLVHLAQLTSLEILSLKGAKVTISGLRELNCLSKLKRMKIEPVQQDNSGLDLAGLTELKKLYLRVAPVLYDKDLKTLGNLAKLESLSLYGQNDFSNEAVKKLRSRLPNLSSFSTTSAKKEKP